MELGKYLGDVCLLGVGGDGERSQVLPPLSSQAGKTYSGLFGRLCGAASW